MRKQFFDIENDNTATFNYRFIQPPQIAYFVTTKDEFGNINSTPVTLGTCNAATFPKNGNVGEFYLTFSMGTKAQNEKGNENHPRDGYINLLKNDEAVVSYIGRNLLQKAVIANMPIPHGISELDVAGLNSFPSTNISVPSIRECPINIECKIINRIPLGNYYMLFVAKAVGISVDQDLIDKDSDGYGVLHINPVFELNINQKKSKNNRLHFGMIDTTEILVPGDEFGSTVDWVGTYDNFLTSEMNRGKITQVEFNHIKELTKIFKNDRSDKTIKAELTDLLRKAINSK
jgi:flavin reductase (DIM6/NTAB) family NADH-FMN oxidoreductase RutF